MGLLSTLLTLPMSGPIHGSLWLARKIHDQAQQDLRDPATIKAALQDLEGKLEAGEIDEDAFEEAEAILLDRLEEGSGHG